jgi:hypothetical protein
MPPDELLLDEALELADDEELALLEDDDELLLDALLDDDALDEDDAVLDEDEDALVEDDELEVPVTHMLATHCCMLAQSPATTHATQCPTPSHTLPPFETQGVLASFAGKMGIPELHAPVRQSLVDTGTLVSSVWGTIPPWPSQTTFWHVPGVCIDTGVPIDVNEVPHIPAVQEGC